MARRDEEDRQRRQREEDEERRRDADIRNRAKSVAELRKTENTIAKQQAPAKSEENKQWV